MSTSYMFHYILGISAEIEANADQCEETSQKTSDPEKKGSHDMDTSGMWTGLGNFWPHPSILLFQTW